MDTQDWRSLDPRAFGRLPQPTVIERIPVAVRQRIPENILDTLTIRSWTDRLLGEMALELSAQMLAHQLPPERVTESLAVTGTETVHLPCPATWRDHWKLTHGHRWWARWWVSRHPARTVQRPVHAPWVRKVTLTVDLKRYRTFPEATVRYPKEWGRHFHVALYETDWSTR